MCSRTAQNTPSVLKSRANAGSAFSDSSCHVASPHEGHAIFGAVELWHPKSPSSVNVTSSKCCKHDSRGTSLACLFAMRRRFSFSMATLSTSVRNLRKKESSESSNVSPKPAFHEPSLTLDVLVWTANVQRDTNYGSDHVPRKVKVARVHQMAANRTNARRPFSISSLGCRSPVKH